MTLLSPFDEATAQQTRPRFSDLPPARRAQRRPPRVFAVALSVIGLLLWGALSAPRLLPVVPQLSALSTAATSWLGSALSGVGHGPGYALGSARAPTACTSDGASAVGSDLTVPANAWVCGDALAMGGSLTVLGHVQGSAQAIGGSVTISGEVDGDVTAVGGSIYVQPSAITHGKLDAIGGQVVITAGATVQTPAPSFEQNWYPGHGGPISFSVLAPGASSFWLGLLFWISAAVGLSAFVPEAIGHVRYTIAHRFLLSGFAGGLMGFVAAVVGAALFLTCIGIPVTLLIALAAWVAWVIGTVAFASWLGVSLLRGFSRRHEPSLLISTIIGVIILCLLKSTPFAGPVVSLIVGVVGLGATLLTLLSARRVSYARLRW